MSELTGRAHAPHSCHTPSVTTLFLDIGGVLLTNGWDAPGRMAAAKVFHLDAEEMDARHHLTSDTYERGLISLDEYLDSVIFYTRRSFSRDEFRKFMFAQTRAFPDMLALFAVLKQRWNLKIIAISNEGREITAYRIQKFGLNALIDAFVCSCFVQFRKPDPQIFQLALDIAQTPPAQVLYIDDRALFIAAAGQVGIRGLEHTGYAETRRYLAELGLVPGPLRRRSHKADMERMMK